LASIIKNIRYEGINQLTIDNAQLTMKDFFSVITEKTLIVQIKKLTLGEFLQNHC
jgi:hypothetical protein